MVTAPIIVALDLETVEKAVRLAKGVEPYVAGFKVGLGLLHGPGPSTVGAIAALGKPVFADAKLHDIPSQVENAARHLGRLGARWVSAHVAGGKPMLAAAVAGLQQGNTIGGILGVTVLTSLDEEALTDVGILATPGKLVSQMAMAAAIADCEGVVCSSKEIEIVAEVAPSLVKVIPGIRPRGSSEDDQQRVTDPADAIGQGADYLVVGRPITRAADPVSAAAEIAAAVLR